MAAQQRLPPKKQVALALLEQASVFVHLDPRSEGVNVPAWFKKQPQLVLQIGLNMAVPIRDLDVSDDGISCTLSFNRSPHFCRLPWRAVFALVGEAGRGMVWPEDVPAEVVAQAEAQKTRVAAKDEPKLYAVQARAEAAPARKEEPPAPAERRPRKAKKPRVKRAPAEREVARPAGRTKAKQPTAEAKPAATASKAKRALPPYLRIIK